MMRAVALISIVVLVASLADARPPKKRGDRGGDQINQVTGKDASTNAKLARPAPEKPVLRTEGASPSGMAGPTMPMVPPAAAPAMDPRARMALMMRAAQMQSMMQQGQGQMGPGQRMRQGMGPNAQGAMAMNDNPFAGMMPRGQGQDMTPLSQQQQQRMMMMAAVQQQQMMQQQMMMQQQQQAMMAAQGRQPTMLNDQQEQEMDPREAMVMLQQQQQQQQLDQIKEMQRQQQEQEGVTQDIDEGSVMPGPIRQSIKAFRERMMEMRAQGRDMGPNAMQPQMTPQQMPPMDPRQRMMMMAAMQNHQMMPQGGPMMGRPPMMGQGPMMPQMSQNPMMSPQMMGGPQMMPAHSPMMQQGPMMQHGQMMQQGPMMQHSPMMQQGPMMPPQMMGPPPMMSQGSPMMAPPMMGRPPMMSPPNPMMMAQNPMMMAQNPMMMAQNPMMPRHPVDPKEIDALRSVLTTGKGPIAIPLHSIQHVIGMENKLTDMRDEIIRSFYKDLMQYKAMSQQFRTQMNAKLALVHQIEAKLATPMRTALANLPAKHQRNIPMTSPNSPPSTIIRRLKESLDDSENKVYTSTTE